MRRRREKKKEAGRRDGRQKEGKRQIYTKTSRMKERKKGRKALFTHRLSLCPGVLKWFTASEMIIEIYYSDVTESVFTFTSDCHRKVPAPTCKRH